MDLGTITQELNKRFMAPLPEFYKRRIVVWYDEEQEFAEQISDIEITGAKIITLTGTNNFQVKKQIGVDEPTENFLIYNPLTNEDPEDDWLIDLEMYSEEFRADLTAIWMDEMGIPQTVALRAQVKRYSKYLNAKSRREDVVKRMDNIDSAPKLQLAIMASLGETQKTDIVSIIKSVLSHGLDMNSNIIYQEFNKYDATDLFWGMVGSYTGYTDVDRSFNRLAAHILSTAGTRTLQPEVYDGLDAYISEPHQAYCYDLVSDWIHSEDADRYVEIAQTVEDEMHMVNRLSKQSAEDLADTEVFPCIDEIILTKLMTDIGNHIINSDQILSVAEKRRTAAWFSEYKDYYAGIVALARIQDFYKEHATGFHNVEPKKIWDEYTSEYYKMDTYYRQFHMNYENSKKSYVSSLHDLFAGVSDKVEGLYTQWFMGELGKNWTDAISTDLRDQGYINGIPRQEDFYSKKIKNADSKVYVIISDAMRYEVAVSLKEQLSREMQSKVTLSGMQGVFPTITKFGMAALLPHEHLTIEYKSDNKAFKVLADGQSTDSTYREKLLKQANENSAVIKAKDLVTMKRADRSELVKGKEVVYIYHDTIDETSHTSEEKVFLACQETIDELKNIVKIIVNDFSGVNIMITADHGFLYNYSPLTEESKTDKSDFVNRIMEYGRRFALLTKGADPEYLVPVKLNYGDDECEGYAPRESVRIKTSAGSGMNFVHGGISLQEMCVPLIEYKHLRNSSKEYLRNKEKYDTKPVKVELLSANHKVSNSIFSLNFYQKDAVGDNREPANYDVYFVDASGKKISDVQKIIADKRGDSAQERTFRCMFNLKSQAFDSKETYYLVIEQENSTDLPERIEFQIDIAFAADDFGFFG
jgi:uncharacterized protein (TIGR02687 family)